MSDKVPSEKVELILKLIDEGKLYKEISEITGVHRKTIARYVNAAGKARSTSDVGKIAHKMILDKPEIVAEIRILIKDHSTYDIAERYGVSAHAIDNICHKYNIAIPDDRKELIRSKNIKAWTDEKRNEQSKMCSELMTEEIKARISEESKRLWQDEDYIRKQQEGYNNAMRNKQV